MSKVIKIGEKVEAIIDLRNFKDKKLPDLGTIADPKNYTEKLPLDELGYYNYLIGQHHQDFAKWFADHAVFVEALSDEFCTRGPKKPIEVIFPDGMPKTFLTWDAFCWGFFGVNADWIRRLIKKSRQMQWPQQPEPEEEEETSDEETATETTTQETTKELLVNMELATKLSMALLELRAVAAMVEQCGDRVPMKLITYMRDAEPRIKALESGVPVVPVNSDPLAAILEKPEHKRVRVREGHELEDFSAAVHGKDVPMLTEAEQEQQFSEVMGNLKKSKRSRSRKGGNTSAFADGLPRPGHDATDVKSLLDELEEVTSKPVEDEEGAE